MSDVSNMSNMSDAGSVPVTDAGDPHASVRDEAMETMRLDGNAAAGVLAAVFGSEMTSAQGACAHCGRIGSLGSLLLYGGVMGTVLRCPACEQVQLRIVRVLGRDGQVGQYWIDLRGMSHLVITAAL